MLSIYWWIIIIVAFFLVTITMLLLRIYIALAGIKREEKAKVSVSQAEGVAHVDENAQPIGSGGSSDNGGSNNGASNLPTEVLVNFPEFYKNWNAKNDALNGEPFNASLSEFIDAAIRPLESPHEETKPDVDGEQV